jgi:phage shock protein E
MCTYRFLNIIRVGMLVAVALSMLACSGAPSQGERTREELAWEWIAKGALVVDVRTKGEFDKQHLDGAILIPYDQIHERTSELGDDKNRPIMLYCRSGRRSGIAAKTLRELGYTQVLNGGGLKPILKVRPE